MTLILMSYLDFDTRNAYIVKHKKTIKLLFGHTLKLLLLTYKSIAVRGVLVTVRRDREFTANQTSEPRLYGLF